MSIQQQMIVRHRSQGHLRLQLPALICTPHCAEFIVAGLRTVEGIYRVDFHLRQGKLSIRFLDTVCDSQTVARKLSALIDQLPALPRGKAVSASPDTSGWLHEKAEEVRETVTALGIVAKQFGKATVGRMSGTHWVGEFLNDLLMLYLIKMHWHSITQSWLPNPWRYRYEWAATFYLIYLHVKSKLPKLAKPPA